MDKTLQKKYDIILLRIFLCTIPLIKIGTDL